MVGGVERGTRPYQDDYQIEHVHVAAIFNNRTSKRAILSNWNIKKGNGYYLVPRNRDLPYTGWRNHHIKEFSKVKQNETILYEKGELPADIRSKRPDASENEKKRKIDDVLVEMRQLIETGQHEEAWTKFPRTYLQYGEKIRSIVDQKVQSVNNHGHPHIWLHGFPGTGKTAVMKFIYPTYYKKDLQNRFFDLYNDKIHTHIMLEDLDHQNVEKLGVQLLKTICDEAGFPIDQKYKTPQLTRASILVTSNYTIESIVPEGKGVDETKIALNRRFWTIRIDQLMRFLGLKMIDKQARNALKEKGNDDTSQIFMAWDYLSDRPLGKPLLTPKEYQDSIKQAYYAL
nr:nonstructural protein [Flumine parvovirus 5]